MLLLTALAASAGSLSTLTSRDLGFEAPDLLTFGVALPHRPYAEEAQRSLAFHEGVRRRLSALAEVDAVSYGVGVPVAHPGWAKPWETADRATTTDVPASHRYRTVARGYFGVLGIPILAGRPFSDAEISGEERAVVVNEALALHYWDSPDEALGRRLRPAGDTSAWARVVGVVGNTADQGAAAPSPAMIYEPASSVGDPRKLAFMQYVLRGASLGDHTIRSVRESLAEMDPQVPAYGFETVESFVRRDIARERMSVAFLGATALAGLLAVSMGLGGLVLVTIARRSREIGVRKALGASDARLRWRSLGPVWRPVVVGMAVGLALVAAGLRVPPALLHDAATWKGHAWTALLVLGPILTAAGYLGSRSVLRIDPAQAFREERW